MSEELPVYRVTVSREGSLWVAEVEGLAGGATDVERFEELSDAVRDLIATLTAAEPDAFWVEWDLLQGSHVLAGHLAELRRWEQLAVAAVAQRDLTRRHVAGMMREAGLSYREIADAIGISHQRVAQILDAGTTGASPQWTDLRIDAMWRAEPHVRLGELLGRNPGDRQDDRPLSPLEAGLDMVLTSALAVSPQQRHDLLTATAGVLAGAADDAEFLRQPQVGAESR